MLHLAWMQPGSIMRDALTGTVCKGILAVAGVLDMFEAGEVALGSGASPACIVSEAGQYSLAHYMARMERNPSAARQKSTLTQLLEAVAYLHGRSMVRLRSLFKWRACKPQPLAET